MNSNARKSESIANQTNFKPDQAPQAFQLIHGKRVDQQGADRIDIMIEAGAPNRHPFLDIECLYFPADDVEGMYDWYKKHFNEGNTRHRPLFYEKATHPGQHCSFQTESKVPGESYEMYVARLETDCIVPLFERVSRSDDIILEPLRDEGADGITFVFTDPQGNKFQIWQDARMEPQPLRDDVLPLIRVAALFFPASDPAATKR
ncbi:MAG: hypothetical protein J7559_00665, partial [Cohnella sp.]|nr:hypothetical protein [Cohnella sp.]